MNKILSLACMLMGVGLIINSYTDLTQTDRLVELHKQLEAQQSKIDAFRMELNEIKRKTNSENQ